MRPILISNAIRRNTQKWLVKGDGYKDPLIFLKSTAPTVERLIDSVDSEGKKVSVFLVCKMMKTDLDTGKTTYTVAHFRSKTHTVFDNVRDEYTIICDRVLYRKILLISSVGVAVGNSILLMDLKFS